MSERRSPVGGMAPRRLPPTTDQGASLIELVVVFGLLVILGAMATPVASAAIEAERVRQAAGFMAARFQLARQQAVSRSASVGVVFDTAGERMTFQVCVDGNGNGIRRAEISAQDSCTEGPYDVSVMFPGVRIAVDPATRGPDGEPGSPDAIRFGRGDIVSFSASGSCTAGSLFLRSRSGLQYVVRVAGVTARMRILRYEAATRTWSE